MQENLLTPLLHKQLTNELDPTDRKILMDWLENSEKNAQFKDEIALLWDLSKNYKPSFKPDVDKAFERFSQKLKGENPKSESQGESKSDRFNPFKPWKLFLFTLMILLGCVSVWQISNYLNIQDVMVSTLDNNVKKISLSDGTLVWLNEKSELRYPTKFRGKERIVELQGEAFFDVAHSRKSTFTIKGGEANILVRGTAFSLNTKNSDGLMEVDVKEGIVELIPIGSDQTLILTKNEMGFYDPDEKKMLPKKLLKSSNADYFIAENQQISESDMSYVFRILGKIYEVDFTFDEDAIKNCDFNKPIQVDKNDLSNTLASIVIDSENSLQFTKLNNRTYMVNGNPCD